MNTTVDIVSTVKDYLASKELEMILFLKQLAKIETPSSSKKAQHKILSLLSEVLREMGFYCIHVKGQKTGGYLFARRINRNKNKPLQLLVGHCDTVWPHKTLKRLKLEQSEDKLKGPGVYDMKAGITQIIFAMKALYDMELTPEVEPVICINSDEEIGSHESTAAIRRLAKISSRVFVLEPPLGLDGKLKTARKGVGRFEVTVKGKAAHAGLDPTKGINAIVELSHQVQKLYAMNDIEKGITVNVGMIQGGISANVIAPKSKAVVDVRVLTAADGIEISDKILNLKPHLSDVILKVKGGIGRPPMEKTARNEVLWNEAKKQAGLLGIELEDALVGGGSDANTTSQYAATIDGMGTPGDGAHADHEFIFHKKMKERTALLVLLLLANPLN